MGRTLMYATLTVLAVFVLSATFLLEHGGGSTSAVSVVSVHDLLLTPEVYQGRDVTLQGVLRFDDAAKRFVVAAEGQGVAIKSNLPETSPLRDQTVRATGRVGIEQDVGVYIDAVVITPVPK